MTVLVSMSHVTMSRVPAIPYVTRMRIVTGMPARAVAQSQEQRRPQTEETDQEEDCIHHNFSPTRFDTGVDK
jgi:hypothetical protein